MKEDGTPRAPVAPPQDETGSPRRGRRRDHTRDGAILDAALTLLGEVGYAALTMDAVATRAKAGKATVYRRWDSKEELVLDAVERLRLGQVSGNPLPDTGSLRGDLVALFRPQTDAEASAKDHDAAGLLSLLTHSPALATAAHHALVDPWADAHRVLMRRAADRGEIPAGADIEAVCQVLPTMAAYRALVQREPFDEAFLLTAVDGVLLPALAHPPVQSPSPDAALHPDRSGPTGTERLQPG